MCIASAVRHGLLSVELHKRVRIFGDIDGHIWGFPKIGVPHSWMIFVRENPMKIRMI